MVKIDSKLHVRCPWCGSENTIEEWDKLTYSLCTNREMRRYYKHLTEDTAFKKKGEYYFKCPTCKRMSKGNTLKITDTDNEYLRSLGGDSNFMVLDKDNTRG